MKRVKGASVLVFVAVGIAVALSPGPGLAAPAARGVSAGLEGAIHAQLGAGPIRFASASGGSAEHPEFGFRLALSADGTTALVSTPGAGNRKGAVYVFHVADAGSWAASSTPAATLTADTRAGDDFGQSLAISADGTTAFVGAPYHGNWDGVVYVFHVSDEGAWASTSTPTALLTGGAGGLIGWGLAASSDGTTVVAGAPFDTYAGGAYVFHVASEDAWVSTSTPTANLTDASNSGSDLEVGAVVALSGDGSTALLDDDAGVGSTGQAYLFHVASEAGWTSSSAPTAILSNSSAAAFSFVGDSLALSGDGTTAFLGAPGAVYYAGAVDVFHASAENAWTTTSTPTAILTNAGGSDGDFLGGFVRVAAGGTTLVAAANGVAMNTGAADVFHVSDEGAWTSTDTPSATLTDSARRPGDILGAPAISADGATLVLGAPWVNWRTGVADVFHVADAASWLTTSTPTARLTNAALPKPACVVPRLIRRRVALAKVFLADSNCRLGKVRKVHTKTKKLRRRIVSQSPAPRRHVAPGSKVNVKVGK